MTKKNKVERAEPAIFEVKVPQEERYRPMSAPFWRGVAYLFEFLPSHRDSRQGRKNAGQVRAVMVVVGLVLMAFGGGEWAGWIVIGAVVAFSAFVLPMKELKKRSIRGRLRERSGLRRREVMKPGSVRIDDRRLELWVGDEKLRHVRIDGDRHEVIFTTHGMLECYGVRPRKGRKKETIWVCCPAIVDPPVPAPEELGLDTAAVIGLEWPEFKEALGVD